MEEDVIKEIEKSAINIVDVLKKQSPYIEICITSNGLVIKENIYGNPNL